MSKIKISVISYVGLHPLPLDLIENMILSQSFSLKEVEFIFIEANSSNTFKEYFSSKNYPCRVIVISGCKTRGHAHNMGIKQSKGDIIYFVADDFILPRTAILSHWNFHQSHTVNEAVGISNSLIPKAVINNFSHWLESSGHLFGVPFSASTASIPSNFFLYWKHFDKEMFFGEGWLV